MASELLVRPLIGTNSCKLELTVRQPEGIKSFRYKYIGIRIMSTKVVSVVGRDEYTTSMVQV